MCTVLLRFAPGTRWPVLLAAVRDEFVERPWEPPAEHWPGFVGGLDRVAGGTWLAVAPDVPSVAALLNGRPPLPQPLSGEGARPSRGGLAIGPLPDEAEIRRYDSFHLVRAGLAGVEVVSWDGAGIEYRTLAAGYHVIVNSGVDVNRLAGFEETKTPDPRPGLPTGQAWGDWVPLLGGGDFTGAEPRPLILRREVAGRVYGSGSATLVALGGDGVRYDFTANPGPDARWREIPLPTGPRRSDDQRSVSMM